MSDDLSLLVRVLFALTHLTIYRELMNGTEEDDDGQFLSVQENKIS